MIIGLIIIILLEILIIIILLNNSKKRIKEPSIKELIEKIERKSLTSILNGNSYTEMQIKMLSQINDLKKD